MVIGLILTFVIIVIDQITKWLFYGKVFGSIIGNFIWFESTLNTGVAFSMFQNNNVFFIIFVSISILLILYLILSKKFFIKKEEKICLGIILGGTISNLIDRIIFGGVRDFIYLKFINFAIFNIADMAISFGAIIFCIILLKNEFMNKNNIKKEDVTTSDTDSN